MPRGLLESLGPEPATRVPSQALLPEWPAPPPPTDTAGSPGRWAFSAPTGPMESPGAEHRDPPPPVHSSPARVYRVSFPPRQKGILRDPNPSPPRRRVSPGRHVGASDFSEGRFGREAPLCPRSPMGLRPRVPAPRGPPAPRDQRAASRSFPPRYPGGQALPDTRFLFL